MSWATGWTIRVLVFHLPAGAGNFYLSRRVQNGSGAHPTSYPMGTSGSFRGVKRPGREADHSPPSSAEVKECVELYLHSPNTPTWRGAQLKNRENFTFYLYKIWSVPYIGNDRYRFCSFDVAERLQLICKSGNMYSCSEYTSLTWLFFCSFSAFRYWC
jgi:hypothetical protein